MHEFSEKRHQYHRIRLKTPLYLHFCCFIFLTMFKCKKLEYSIHRHFTKRHDYAINWPGQCLTYALISICNYWIFKSRRVIQFNKTQRFKIPLNANEYVERDIIFDTYFHAGDRHHTIIEGNLFINIFKHVLILIWWMTHNILKKNVFILIDMKFLVL